MTTNCKIIPKDKKILFVVLLVIKILVLYAMYFNINQIIFDKLVRIFAKIFSPLIAVDFLIITPKIL